MLFVIFSTLYWIKPDEAFLIQANLKKPKGQHETERQLQVVAVPPPT